MCDESIQRTPTYKSPKWYQFRKRFAKAAATEKRFQIDCARSLAGVVAKGVDKELRQPIKNLTNLSKDTQGERVKNEAYRATLSIFKERIIKG